MTKDGILQGIAYYIEARRVAASLSDIVVRPHKSVLNLPETGSILLVTADDLEHNVGHFYRLEPLRLRVQTQGLTDRDTAAHKAAMQLCHNCFPDPETDDWQDAHDDLTAAISAVESDAALSFWFVQGEREQPIEDAQWWEDQLVVRVGLRRV